MTTLLDCTYRIRGYSMKMALKSVVSTSLYCSASRPIYLLFAAAWALCGFGVDLRSCPPQLFAVESTESRVSRERRESATRVQASDDGDDAAAQRASTFLALFQDSPPNVTGSAASSRDGGPRVSLPYRTPIFRKGELGDWRDVGVGEDRLSRNLRAQWVTLSREGSLSGRLTTFGSDGVYLPASDVTLTLVQSGQVVTRVTIDEIGEFQLDEFAPGVYSVVASGRKGFAAYTLMVLPYAERFSRQQGSLYPVGLAHGQPVEDRLQMDVTALSPTFDTLRNLLEQYYPQMEVSTLDEATYDRILEDASQGAVGRFGIRALTDAPLALPPASTVRARPVYLQPDGILRGRLMGIDPASGRPQMIRRMNVFILRDDRIVARSSVDELGIFEIRGLPVGRYGVIAAGQDGFGAMAFELAAPLSEVSLLADAAGEKWIRIHNQPESGSLSLGVVGDPRDLAAALGDTDLPFALPGAAGGDGGNDGNPGGGGGGGGGAGDGLGFLGAGLIGAAAARNNSLRDPASPASPLLDDDF